MNIVNPFPMQWEKKYKEVFPEAIWSKNPLEGHDLYLFMWANEDTEKFINGRKKTAKYVVFVRRYEFFGTLAIDWSKVDEIIFVNDYLAECFEMKTGIRPHVIYNGVNLDDWTFTGKPGKQIAWVGYINLKKNLPLALQIMDRLPKDYELHIVGAIQDNQVMLYTENLAKSMELKIVYNGEIPREHMDHWLSDKSFILSTAISEGCPNNVLEGMAKGLKPIVHNWPGAMEQFRGFVFNTPGSAVDQILSGYDPIHYRQIVSAKFGEANYLKVKELCQ